MNKVASKSQYVTWCSHTLTTCIKRCKHGCKHSIDKIRLYCHGLSSPQRRPPPRTAFENVEMKADSFDELCCLLRINVLKVKQGMYGTAYVTQNQGGKDFASLNEFLNEFSSDHHHYNGNADPDKKLLIKVQLIDDDDHLHDLMCEENIQSYVSRATAYSAAEIAATMYSASTVTLSSGRKLRVVVMQYVKGVPMKTFIKKHKDNHSMLMRLYNSLERTLVFLWLSRVVHGDLHLDNIIITKDIKVCLIDYGFSLYFGDDVRMQPFISELLDGIKAKKRMVVHRMFKRSMDAYISSLLYDRGYSSYNPDFKVLRYIYHLTHVQGNECVEKRLRFRYYKALYRTRRVKSIDIPYI